MRWVGCIELGGWVGLCPAVRVCLAPLSWAGLRQAGLGGWDFAWRGWLGWVGWRQVRLFRLLSLVWKYPLTSHSKHPSQINQPIELKPKIPRQTNYTNKRTRPTRLIKPTKRTEKEQNQRISQTEPAKPTKPNRARQPDQQF